MVVWAELFQEGAASIDPGRMNFCRFARLDNEKPAGLRALPA
ncbi:MAG: hypothetical protein JWM58_2651 [Rhizobium sp.]|nr:hypothetical protein [Rhizobium sp.]